MAFGKVLQYRWSMDKLSVPATQLALTQAHSEDADRALNITLTVRICIQHSEPGQKRLAAYGMVIRHTLVLCPCTGDRAQLFLFSSRLSTFWRLPKALANKNPESRARLRAQGSLLTHQESRAEYSPDLAMPLTASSSQDGPSGQGWLGIILGYHLGHICFFPCLLPIQLFLDNPLMA